MIRNFTYTLITSLAFVSIKFDGNPKPVYSQNSIYISDTVDKNKIAVLPFELLESKIFKDYISTMITDDDFKNIENLLKIFVAEYNQAQENQFYKFPEESRKNHRLILLNMDSHKRQYIPMLNKKNEKEIWINCFCKTPENQNWKKEIIKVEGGGKCYFNLILNLTTLKYSNVFFNKDKIYKNNLLYPFQFENAAVWPPG